MQKPYFDNDRFAELLEKEIGSALLARKMMRLQVMYSYCIGLVADRDAIVLLGDLDWVQSFKQRHQVGVVLFEGSPTYNPNHTEQIFIDVLGVTEATARTFTNCAESYLRSIGAL